MAPKLTTPHIRVVYDDDEHDTYAYNRDLVEYEQLSGRNPTRYPPATGAPFGWLNYLAYKAGVREGWIGEGVNLATFTETAREVTIVDEAAAVDPTPTDRAGE